MKAAWLFPLLIILADGCVDPFPLPDTGFDSKIVIFGNINQLPGPYEVQVFRSSDLEDNRDVQYERNATVWIYDDEGNAERLEEVEFGIYHTRNFLGVVGRSYHITVETSNGEKYESSAQKIPGVVPVKNLYHEFTPDAVVTDAEGSTRDAFNLYVDTEGTSDNNLFRWRWTGIHTVRAYPELHDTMPPGAGNPIPKPLKCSGYIKDPRSEGGIRKVGECLCCICYSTYYNTNAIVSDNTFVSQNTFNKISLGSIVVNPVNFYEKYFVEVEQFSLNEESYNFWKLIQSQQQATGSLFQPNSVRIQGNIRSKQNPNETALGIFEAVSVSRRSMFIGREDIPYEIDPIAKIGEDCRFTFPNSTITKPTFW